MEIMHPRIKMWLELSALLFEAADAGTAKLSTSLRPRRRAAYVTRRPGPETPMWNVLIALLRTELKPLGTKARLARYLGIPKQRLNDFLTDRSRQPDAELTLRLLHWLSVMKAGRDLSL